MDNVERIEAALRKLPIMAHRDARDVRIFAMEINLASVVSENNNIPAVQESTKKQAVTELAEFGRRALDLSEHISSTRATAIKAFWEETGRLCEQAGTQFRPRLLDALQADLRGTIEIAIRSAQELQADESPDRKGRKKKGDAALITDSVARAYRGLTGKDPTRQVREVLVNAGWDPSTFNEGGDCEVFDILEVDASPVSQA